MAIPGFQNFMLPVLKSIGSRKVSTSVEVVRDVAGMLNLSDVERATRLPSGAQPIVDNRALWAVSYLSKAGLVERPRRGSYVITPEGSKVLASAPDHINIQYLNRFESFKEFFGKYRRNSESSVETVREAPESQTPTERLEDAARDIRAAVENDLLNRVRNIDPTDFERLVLDLLHKMGYGGLDERAISHTGRPGDEGIDGEIRQDPLGLDMIYVQAKRYREKSPVRLEELHRFRGSLDGRKARKGVFMTTSTFDPKARKYAESAEVRIILIDGTELSHLLYDHGIGVTTEKALSIKKVDEDFFSNE